MSDESVISVPIDDLILGDIRKEKGRSFRYLVESIKELGLIHPIVVAKVDDGQGAIKYRVICGRRRVLAHKELGYTHVPSVVRDMGDVHEEMAVISENCHRLELGAERDKSIRRYVELYNSLNPTAEEDAEARKAVGMGWVDPESDPEVKEAIERPIVPTPVDAAAKVFGVTRTTVNRAVRRARGFTDAQRRVLDDAGISKADLDVLVAEDEEVVKEVVNLIAAGYGFDESMVEVLKSSGRTYIGRDGSLEEMDSRLAKLSARRGIGDAEAFDNDCKLFWAIEEEVRKFKKAIDWVYKKEIAGKNPHGLYYRRMLLFLESKNPRHWVPCRCQQTGDDRWSCAYCRSGAYQIGE